jgi:phenylpropionate dioxygenase-like ring-hydroxylating dioxygenase large terminal subunit
MALDRNFSSLRNLSFIVFQKKTPDIKHHLAQAHSDPIIPYHTSQQPRQRSCFFATHKFEGPIKRQERGVWMGADKNSPQRTRPKSHSQLQMSHTNTSRQDNVVLDQLQVLGVIPWSTRGSTRVEAKEPIKLGKFLRTGRTVRLAVADCPPGWERIVR